jgi:hypothetical protein
MKAFPENRQYTWAVVISCLLAGAIYLPIIMRFTTVAYDYIVHIGLTAKLINDGDISTPHFLLHLAVAALSSITPAGVRDATVILLLTAVIATAFLVSRSLVNDLASPLLIPCLTTALLLAAPVAILFPVDKHLYLGYISTNVLHNPTIILLKPLALLSFCYAAGSFDNNRVWSGYSWLPCAVTTIACALTKPNFTICILPALALMVIQRLYKKEPFNLRLLLFGFFLPAIIILALQFRMTYSSSQLQGVYAGSSHIIFAPLVVMKSFSSWLPAKFLLSLVFPLTLLLCYFRAAIRDTGLQLGWLAFLCGAAFTYLLAESGPRLFQGNFTWSGQITLFILFVYSVRFLFREKGGGGNSDRNRFYLCNAALLVHFCFGIAFFIAEYLKTERYW